MGGAIPRPSLSSQELPLMAALATAHPDTNTGVAAPRILVFSTNNISDPGIDLAGTNHLHYSPGVRVISLPCTSGIRPTWILHAIQQGFEGVFIASDGDECAYLPDCAKRAAKIVSAAQALLKENSLSPQRLRMAAICSVCATQFAGHMNSFGDALIALRTAGAKS